MKTKTKRRGVKRGKNPSLSKHPWIIQMQFPFQIRLFVQQKCFVFQFFFICLCFGLSFVMMMGVRVLKLLAHNPKTSSLISLPHFLSLGAFAFRDIGIEEILEGDKRRRKKKSKGQHQIY